LLAYCKYHANEQMVGQMSITSIAALAVEDKDEAITGVQVFSTCPSSLTQPDRYLQRVAEVARWSEAAGCAGLLVYTDNTLVDPWLVSQIILQNTATQRPLVAVQPVYMHPYSAAKMISSLALLHGRQVYLNMVAGGFKNDLVALNDPSDHDARYERLIEYTLLIRRLLESRGPVTFEGRFYSVKGLTLQPSLPSELMPEILVSGSSEAGRAAAARMSAIPVKYPEPPEKCASLPPDGSRSGIRIGIIARPEEEEAWHVAFERFPEDRKGQLARKLAEKVSDSAWHKSLSELSKSDGAQLSTYWLHPFENYQTNCPYLVGSYSKVAGELQRYIASGNATFILDIPPAEEEFQHTGAVFRLALRSAAA
jgi:alkanesulfonate monooxygenase